jgi:pimeloyl-ACP methyl ester carboxylesterase
MLSRTDTTSSLNKISIPTLIIVGENDALTPPAVMKSLNENIPNSEFVVIPKAGHMTPIEEPEAVNEAIERFLKHIGQ